MTALPPPEDNGRTVRAYWQWALNRTIIVAVVALIVGVLSGDRVVTFVAAVSLVVAVGLVLAFLRGGR